MPSNSPYATRAALESIKHSAGASADALPIEDHMLLWTPAEAKAFFESGGASAPDTAGRSLEDKAPPGNKVGPRQAKQDLIFTLCCPCCDMLIADQLDKRAKRKAEKVAGGPPPASQAMSR